MSEDQKNFYKARIESVMRAIIPKKKKLNKETLCLPWTLRESRKTEYAYQYAYNVPTGMSYETIAKHLQAFTATCGSHVELKDRGGVIVISVYPNALEKMIRFRDKMLNIVDSPESALVGFNIRRQPIIHHFNIPHMLVAGQSGYGKTDFLRWIIYNICSQLPPHEVEINIIDLKMFSFIPFMDVPHVKRVATDLRSAVNVLDYAYRVMLERAQLVLRKKSRDLAKHFPWLFVVIDEASQIAPALKINKDEKMLATLAAQRASAISCVGREAKVGIIFATQYPTKEVIHGQIRANMEAVTCFKVENHVHSSVALGSTGAEDIPCIGRAIFKSRGVKEIIQVPFVGKDDVWENRLFPITKMKGVEVDIEADYRDIEVEEVEDLIEINDCVAFGIDGTDFEIDLS